MFSSSYYGSFDPNNLSWSPNENDIINQLVYHKNYTVLLKEYITELIGKYYLTEEFYKSLL